MDNVAEVVFNIHPTGIVDHLGVFLAERAKLINVFHEDPVDLAAFKDLAFDV